MAQNTSPIFPLTPKVAWVSPAGQVANTTTDLTAGTNYNSNFTAGVDGARLDFVRIRPLGTNVQTVMRVWINNGGATTTASNNILFFERTLSSATVSQTVEQADTIVPLNVSVPAGYKIYFTFGTAVAAGFACSTVGGDY